MLFHGLSSSPLELQTLGRGLQRAGYTVYLPYIPGYGGDPLSKNSVVPPWQDWLASALHSFDLVRREHEKVAVGGLCMGATLGLMIAAQRSQEVAAMLALSVTLWHDGWALPWYTRLLPLAAITPMSVRRRFSYRERSPYGVKDERMRSWIEREMNNTQSSMAGAATLSFADLLEARRLFLAARRILPRVESPTLIIHAVEDEMSSPRNAEYLARHVGARQTRLVMLRDSYHMITLDREKDKVLAEVKAFLSPVMAAEPADSQSGVLVPFVQQ